LPGLPQQDFTDTKENLLNNSPVARKPANLQTTAPDACGPLLREEIGDSSFPMPVTVPHIEPEPEEDRKGDGGRSEIRQLKEKMARMKQEKDRLLRLRDLDMREQELSKGIEVEEKSGYGHVRAS
jgi:hypothetical protein